MEKIEEKIREKLAKRLDILSNDLTLLDQEAFLPNKKGTRGFVDLLAVDSEKRYVLIELKRSKAASREAIHEIFKYIEGIKGNKSLKNDEIIAYIVSTEWDELIVPFSSFVSQVSYDVIGYKLKVDSDLNPIQAERIEPLNIENERFISDEHAICLYTNEENLKKGIDSHTSCFAKKGIKDYLLLILKAHPNFREYALQTTAQSLEGISSQFGADPSITHKDLQNLIPEYTHMIYSAVQVMSIEQYWEIIKQDPDEYEEAREIAEEMEEEELMHYLHGSAVENSKPRPFQEYYEIGYPAKLRHKILEEEQWEIIDVIRHGKLEENKLLTNDVLINELTGDSGTNKQTYTKNFNSNNKSSFEQMQKDVEKCLVDNDIWLTGLSKGISEINTLAKEYIFEGQIHIFNPSNTLLSIYRSATSSSLKEAMRYIPSYYITIESEDIIRSYFGCLTRNGNSENLENVLIQAYDNGAAELLLSLTWGGYQTNDIDICPIYGLEYTNFMLEIRDDKRSLFKFDGYRYKPYQEFDPYSDFFQFMQENNEFVEEIIKLFGEATLTPGLVKFENKV